LTQGVEDKHGITLQAVLELCRAELSRQGIIQDWKTMSKDTNEQDVKGKHGFVASFLVLFSTWFCYLGLLSYLVPRISRGFCNYFKISSHLILLIKHLNI
jgi:hypothetical protein